MPRRCDAFEREGAKHNLRNEERKRNVEYPTNERLSFNQSFANRSGIVGRFSLFWGGFWSILALRDQSITWETHHMTAEKFIEKPYNGMFLLYIDGLIGTDTSETIGLIVNENTSLIQNFCIL